MKSRSAHLLPVLSLALVTIAGCGGYGPPRSMKSDELVSGPVSTAMDKLSSPKAEERRWSIIAISRSGKPNAMDIILPFLDVNNEQVPVVRASAAEAMRVIGDKRAVPALAKSAADIDPLVRMESVKSLGLLGGEPQVPQLVYMLRMDRDTTVAVAAARALGTIGGAQAKEALTVALNNPNEMIAFGAREALDGMKATRTEKNGEN